MKLWVDDLRDPVEWTGETDWIWAKTYSVAIDYLRMGDVTLLSLDHDLGDFDIFGREQTGYDVAIWMAEFLDSWPKDGVRCHSANPIGRERILGVVERYGGYA